MDASPDELALARENLDEPDWAHGPPVVTPVDPREVPELGTFFSRKRVTLVRLGVFCLAMAIPLCVGAAKAIGDEWNEAISKDPSSIELRRIPVHADTGHADTGHIDTGHSEVMRARLPHSEPTRLRPANP